MADLLALAEKFEKMATLDNSTLKRIERAKELADIVEEFSLVFQKSPDEAKTKYGSRTLKLIAMALTAELDFIREDIRAAMREHGKKASQYTGKRFEKMAGFQSKKSILGSTPQNRDEKDYGKPLREQYAPEQYEIAQKARERCISGLPSSKMVVEPLDDTKFLLEAILKAGWGKP